MFDTYNLHRHMQSYTFLSYHGSFKVIYIFYTYLISMNNYCYHDCLCYIYYHYFNLYSFSYLQLHITVLIFIYIYSYIFIMHAFTHSYFHICLSFVYMYSFPVTSYILLTYIFMYFIRLSYLMTYTYTFLYLYVLLVLYQTVLSPVGVQNIDFFFDTLRYLSCPNYLPFIFSYLDTHTYKHSLSWTGDKE